MPASLLGSQLTEAHRLAQARLGAKTVTEFLPTWDLLDLDNLDRGLERWLSVTTPIVQAAKTQSARLAANYYTTFRTVETGPGGFTPHLADVVDVAQLHTSLLVTGPWRLKSAIGRGLTLLKATEIAKVSSAGATMRQSLNGGRDTFVAAVGADKRASGWQRVTSGSPCDFCQMLSGRIYPTDNADFQAHDHCSCSAEVVF